MSGTAMNKTKSGSEAIQENIEVVLSYAALFAGGHLYFHPDSLWPKLDSPPGDQKTLQRSADQGDHQTC